MAYDLHLAERMSQILTEKNVGFNEKKMFGGVCFMVDGKMCMGVVKNQVMARVDPENEQDLLNRKGAKPMDFTGRPMKGYLYISSESVDMDADLTFWVEQCLAFNPKAKASKKK